MPGRQSRTALLDLATEQGLARAHLDTLDGAPAGALVLGHGAGGGVEGPDLLGARDAAVQAGWLCVRLEQPWRVAGRRVAPPPLRLDAATRDALGAWEPPAGVPLVLGGRSAGARVACRLAVGLEAAAVLALAFPLHPPGRPERSRAPELAGAGVPVLVVQGQRDAFGTAEDVAALGLAHVTVRPVPGDHGMRSARAAVRDAVRPWLAKVAARG